MPIAGLLIAAAGSTGVLMEVAKKNNARLFLYVDNIIKLINQQFPGDNSWVLTVGNAFQTGIFPLEVSFTPPVVTVETRNIKGKGNAPLNWAGYSTFDPCSCTFNNFVGIDTYKFFYRWATIAAGLLLKRESDDRLTPLNAATNNTGQSTDKIQFLPVPDTSSQSPGYKVNAVIAQYFNPLQGGSDKNKQIGDDKQYSRWILQGIWPTSVSTEGFNLEDHGEMIKTNVQFAVDLCLPETP